MRLSIIAALLLSCSSTFGQNRPYNNGLNGYGSYYNRGGTNANTGFVYGGNRYNWQSNHGYTFSYRPYFYSGQNYNYPFLYNSFPVPVEPGVSYYR